MTAFNFIGLKSSIVATMCILALTPFANADSVGKATEWTPNSPTVIQGRTSDVILTAPAAVCGVATSPLIDSDLESKKPMIAVQAGFDVTVATGSPTHSKICELTVSLVVANNAKTGPLRLTITMDPDHTPIGFSTVTVTSSAAGPIPDGLAPQVDIEWDVLGYKTVSDNYGSRVADNYFGVVITIGNNTGFPLQLSGAGFKIRQGDVPSPTANTALVQGTMLYGEDYSARNLAYRALVWAALIAAAVNPYFHSINAKANYSAGVALFTGGIVTGFQQFALDNTVKQLARLNSSEVMTDQNVIPNNSQVPFVAFVSRDSVCPPGDKKHASLCGSRNKIGKRTFYDPTKIRESLNEITITGKQMPNFSPRIRMTAITPGPLPSTGSTDANAIQGFATPIKLQSSGLTGALLTSVPSGVTVTPDVGPTDSSFPVRVLASVASKTPIQLTLMRKDSTQVTFPVLVEPPVLVVSLPAGTTAIPVGVATPVTFSWQSGGPDLTNATVSMTSPATDGTVTQVTKSATQNSIPATITAKRAGVLPITFSLQINGAPLQESVSVTAK